MTLLVPPVSYQGGKTRLAPQIVDRLLREKCVSGKYYDLCCGCGAVSLELVRRDVKPENITMVDSGPWGRFWRSIGRGTFDLNLLRDWVATVPEDPRRIQNFMQNLSVQPPRQRDAVFLLLQAASFGGKPVSIEDDKWRVHGFRGFWEPTATSNRRSHVNPMMPMPKTILERVGALVEHMRGVNGKHRDVADVPVRSGSVFYVDPPYDGLTAYARSFNIRELIRNVLTWGSVCAVS